METGKNAYEIRTDLLKMAKDMLDKQYEVSLSAAWDCAEAMKDSSSVVNPMEYMPKMFTPEEVIAQAEKLQQFVNKK